MVSAGLPGPPPAPESGRDLRGPRGDSRAWGRALRDLVSRCQGRRAERAGRWAGLTSRIPKMGLTFAGTRRVRTGGARAEAVDVPGPPAPPRRVEKGKGRASGWTCPLPSANAGAAPTSGRGLIPSSSLALLEVRLRLRPTTSFLLIKETKNFLI